MYKVLANVLKNKLKSIVDTVIDETQSIFMMGKQISHGISMPIEIYNYAIII